MRIPKKEIVLGLSKLKCLICLLIKNNYQQNTYSKSCVGLSNKSFNFKYQSIKLFIAEKNCV